MAKKHWEINAPTNIVVNSIFAAIAGILFVFVLQDTHLSSSEGRYLSLPFLFSFFFISWAAERTTDALDKKDTKKYVAYFLPYNIGVILLFLGICLIFLQRYDSSLIILFFVYLLLCYPLWFFLWFILDFEHSFWPILAVSILLAGICLRAWQWYNFCFGQSLVAGLMGLIFLGFSSPWLVDSWYIVCWKEEDFNEYLKELEGTIKPSTDPHKWEGLFYGLRKIINYFRRH